MAVIPGEGSTLEIDGKPIANLQGCTLDQAIGEVEVTNLSSTVKEYRLGLPDGGSFSFECDYDGSQEFIRNSTEYLPVVVTLSNGATLAFDAIRLSWDLGGVEVEGNVTLSVEMRTKAIVYTPPAP